MGHNQFIVDDWGMSPAVNEAALYLAERGQLHGISVLPYSRFYSYKLKEILATGVKVGCHINFTFETEFGVNPRESQWALITFRILKVIFTGMVLSHRIFSLVEKQVQWVKKNVGRLDYIDGHHHIHLYPGMLQASRKVCLELGVPLRIIADKGFKSNFLLALYAKSRCEKQEYFECLYLSPQEYNDKTILRAKVADSKGSLISIHPAVREDFIENGVKDHYVRGRVCQFQHLKDILEI